MSIEIQNHPRTNGPLCTFKQIHSQHIKLPVPAEQSREEPSFIVDFVKVIVILLYFLGQIIYDKLSVRTKGESRAGRQSVNQLQ